MPRYYHHAVKHYILLPLCYCHVVLLLLYCIMLCYIATVLQFYCATIILHNIILCYTMILNLVLLLYCTTIIEPYCTILLYSTTNYF